MEVTLGSVGTPLQAGKNVVCIEHNQTIGEAMQILARHGILSAPVLISPDLEDLGELRTEEPRPQLLGWLDVNDIVRAFVASIEGKLGSRHMLHMMAVLEEEGPAFADRHVITIVGGEDKRLIYEGDRDLPLREAIEKYFMSASKAPAVHRVAIFSATGSVERVISQMDVLKYVCSHADRFPALASKSLADAGLVDDKREIASIDINEATLKALMLLVQGGRSAVAVMSSDKKLITNLSTSDLRYLQPNHFGVLALPVGEFLGLLHGAVYVGARAVDGDMSAQAPQSGAGPPQHQFFADRKGSQQVPLITCAKDESVLGAIQSMVDNHVHRVYVVDDPKDPSPTPLAVVTTTDVLRVLAKDG